MGLLLPENKETIVLAASVVLVVSVFSIAIYSVSIPREHVWIGRVFDSVKTDSGWTVIRSYGEDTIALKGSYNIEVGATYKITYHSSLRVRYTVAERVISIEKLEG